MNNVLSCVRNTLISNFLTIRVKGRNTHLLRVSSNEEDVS